MKAAIIDKPGCLRVVEAPEPELGDQQVLLAVQACGICGTDAHIFADEYNAAYPLIPGHEFSAEVEAVGAAVDDIKPGERVVVQPNTACGRCAFCRDNLPHFCTRMRAYGVHQPGGLAARCAVDRANVYRVGDMPFDVACFAEPLSCCLHGIAAVGTNPGEHVLLCGCGPIGLLLLQLVRLSGAATITVVDLAPAKLDLALRLGATRALAPEELDDCASAEHPDGFPLVIDATGNTHAVASLIPRVRNHGRLLCFGVCPPGETIAVSPYELFARELTLAGAFSLNNEMPAAVDLLAAGRIETGPLVSHRWPLERTAQALRLKTDGGDSLKVIIQPST